MLAIGEKVSHMIGTLFTFVLSAGVILGGGVGALLLKNADDGALCRIFAAVVLAAGIRYLLF